MKFHKLEYKPCRFYSFNKTQMKQWREINELPKYINAAYVGSTGAKSAYFLTNPHARGYHPEVTKDLYEYEEEVLQELKNLRKKPFGYIRAIWRMSQKFGTGEPWDTKFMPQFPGRDPNGRIQYARYNGEIVSCNDLSNIMYGHICAFMNIPKAIAKIMAQLDACGITEIFTKQKFPTKELLKFSDTTTDQLAISKGIDEFNIKNYRIK